MAATERLAEQTADDPPPTGDNLLSSFVLGPSSVVVIGYGDDLR
jgi:hypothetical protein